MTPKQRRFRFDVARTVVLLAFVAALASPFVVAQDKARWSRGDLDGREIELDRRRDEDLGFYLRDTCDDLNGGPDFEAVECFNQICGIFFKNAQPQRCEFILVGPS